MVQQPGALQTQHRWQKACMLLLLFRSLVSFFKTPYLCCWLGHQLSIASSYPATTTAAWRAHSTDEELIAAPGSLASIKSHLSSDSERLGRSRDWNPATQTGNPMLSVQIRTMLKGYGNHAAQLGHQKRGALPLTAAEMQLLLHSMLNLCNGSNTDEQLLLLRDAMLFSLLWQLSSDVSMQGLSDWTTLFCQMAQVPLKTVCTGTVHNHLQLPATMAARTFAANSCLRSET